MKPWLWFPAEISHRLAPLALELGAQFLPGVPQDKRTALPFLWKRKNHSVYFRNPLGTAGGVDKDGRQIAGWEHFGAGFVEVGTVTPKRQSANPGKIMMRLTAEKALWNKMGFPSPGAQTTLALLRDFRIQETLKQPDSRFPVFVNLGKQRETPLEKAHLDYLSLLETFTQKTSWVNGESPVDAFVINISSPNTKGLRSLFQPEYLRSFLEPISEKLGRVNRPGLLKLSPDLTEETHHQVLEAIQAYDLDGVILTNTTSTRPKGLRLPSEGGLSGLPLQEISRSYLKQAVSYFSPFSPSSPHLSPTKELNCHLIVSAGGVIDADEALYRLKYGAHLVESYSGLIFSGPGFFSDCLKKLT